MSEITYEATPTADVQSVSPHGHAGHSSNLACSGNRFWPRAHCGLDVSLRIRARQNNRDGNLKNCKGPRQKSEVRLPAKPTKRPQVLRASKLQAFRPGKTPAFDPPLPPWNVRIVKQFRKQS